MGRNCCFRERRTIGTRSMEVRVLVLQCSLYLENSSIAHTKGVGKWWVTTLACTHKALAWIPNIHLKAGPDHICL